NDLECCNPIRAEEAIDFLIAGSGFLPSVVKAQDDHYINSIYLLQYFDQFKIAGYDFYCPSLDKETYF
ncbi:38591_t:CDS:1, partial [Gigaspora margarita]